MPIEEEKDSPVTQKREFGFIKDLELRKVLKRDYLEIQTAYVARCWKSVIMLSGGAIEAIELIWVFGMPRRQKLQTLRLKSRILQGGTW